MAGKRPIRPEVAGIFERLDALGQRQRALADALGLQENKVSKIKSGERQFRGDEMLRALQWLDEMEQGDGGDVPPAPAAEPEKVQAKPDEELLARLLLALSPSFPRGQFSESAARALSGALLHGLELLQAAGHSDVTDRELAIAAHAAVVRFREAAGA